MIPPQLSLAGVPLGTLKGTRVLKAHRTAAQQAVEEATGHPVTPEQADRIAAAVICAEDNRKPEYVIGLRTPAGGALILGRYRTYTAAVNASQLELPYPHTQVGVWPIIPFPKRETR